MHIHLILLLTLAAGGLAMLLTRSRRLAGTTLIAPYRWSMFALLTIAGIECLLVLSKATPNMVPTMRYLSATTTLCPLVAVLGAKRPQNVGWQFIVATLWIVMILPVGETMLLWRGGTLDVGPMRSWLLMILLAIGLSNYLLTRFWLAAAAMTAGQTLLLSSQLPTVVSLESSPPLFGFALIIVALAMVWWQTRRSPTSHGWPRVWRDFRDAYGLVWSLRVMERVNSTAKLSGWYSELTWHGFVQADDSEATESEAAEINRAMRTTLRRFVSPEWIDDRMTYGTDDRRTLDA